MLNKYFATIFFTFILAQMSFASYGNDALIQYCASVEKKVLEEKRFIENLAAGDLLSMPFGMQKRLGGVEYTLLIDSMSIVPGAKNTLRAFMCVEVPGRGKKLYFMGENIAFTQGGLAEGAKLTLLQDVKVDISKDISLTFRGNEGKTIIILGCDGYESMQVQCELEFSRSIILPEDAQGNIKEGTVNSVFEIKMVSFIDFLTSIQMPTFQIAKLPGFSFHIQDATLDFSEVANAPDFAKDYQSPQMDNLGSTLFQGIYIRELEVKFPRSTKSKDNIRPSLICKKLILDEYGVSGKLSGSKILSLDKGSLGKWAFSIDSAYFSLNSNAIEQASFTGSIVAPVISEQTPLGYRALIQNDGNYSFQIQNIQTLKMDMWAAKLNLAENSALEIQVENQDFYPKAILNGTLDVEGAKVQLAQLRFENLVIQRKSPILSVTYFALASEKLAQKMASFPISLKELGLRVPSALRAGLDIHLRLNLTPATASSLAAEGGLEIMAKIDTSQLRPKFEFEKIEIKKLAVDINTGAYTIKGDIQVYTDDPTYGDGFKGSVRLSLVEKFALEASAQFGALSTFRYFYVDGLMMIPGGIPVFTGVAMYGFGGGISYKMKPSVKLPVLDAQTISVSEVSDVGKSASGIEYVPNEMSGIGVRATVVIGTHPSPNAFNGDVTFEIVFNSSGGLQTLTMRGNANFMRPPATAGAAGQSSAAVSATLFFLYDKDNQSLYGNIKAYVQVPGVLRGSGPNNLAGEANLFFSPSEWYIRIGEPEKGRRVGLNVAGLMDLEAYLCMGTQIPALPAPDVKFSEVSPKNTLDGANSRGFIFGASAAFGTGDINFLAFYASFQAGLGFDVMMSQYDLDVRCEGQNGPIGINGWYAQGQLYAHLQGKVGMRVNLKTYSGNFEIFQVNGALLMEGKLPNPSWFKGKVESDYSVLDGLVKGRCKFEVELGKKCVMLASNPVAGLEVISECTPSIGAKKVDVTIAPQVAFNVTIDKQFDVIDINGAKRSIKVALDHFQILDGNVEIQGKKEWNEDNNVYALSPRDMLPQNKTLKLKVKVIFYEWKDGRWQTIMVDKRAVEESKEYSFETGDGPQYIRHEQVDFSYPLIGQYNLYTNETSQGFIKLKQGGWGYLFEKKPDFSNIVRFASQGEQLENTITYDNSTMRVNFTLPKDLKQDKIYTYQLVKKPISTSLKVDANVKDTIQKSTLGSNVDAEIRTKDIEGELNVAQEKSMFDAVLRTSLYTTFKEKMQKIMLVNSYEIPTAQGIDEIGSNFRGPELFSIEELSTSYPNKGMIRFEAYTDNAWFTNYNDPRLYNNYPNLGITIQNRDVQILGIRPTLAIKMAQSASYKLNSDGSVESTLLAKDFANLMYHLDFYVGKDYYELRDEANEYMRKYGKNTWAANLANSNYVGLFRDNYKLQASYFIPGSTSPTSSVDMVIDTR